MPDQPTAAVNKQLIVVVHGVGIRAAGESSDMVAGALDGTMTAGEQDGFRRYTSDDFKIFEHVPGATSPITGFFPARLIRFRKFKGQFTQPDSPGRVIADFYWGDVGGFATSAPAVLVGLGRIMLGLAHVVRENALTVFPDLSSPSQSAWRALARGAALAIHGPIFALNITLFVGLIFVVLIGDHTHWVSVLTALSCLALAIWLQIRSQSFLLRHMGAYLAIAGLLLLLFVLLDAIADGALALPWIDTAFRNALCSWKDTKTFDICQGKHGRGPFLHSMRLQGLMVLIWSGIAVTALIFGLRWIVARLRGDPTSRSDLIMPTLSLMMLLWFTLIGLGWAVTAALYGQIGPGLLVQQVIPNEGPCGLGPFKPGSACYFGADSGLLFTTSLRGVWAALATLLILVLTGVLFLAFRRYAARRVDPARYMEAADRNADRLRMVVPGCLLTALMAMPVFILILIFESATSPTDLCKVDAASKFLCTLDQYMLPLLSYAVAGLLAVVPFVLHPMTLGINVAGDVIIYLNDFHWRRTPDAPPSRTFAEIVFPGILRWRRNVVSPAHGYAFRIRIQKRLRQLVRDLIRTEEPDRIDFVAHSQGTVITLDVLSTKGEYWGRDHQLTLITMGSPRRHLYQRYFVHAFPELAAPPAGVQRWTNIFRIDDFIGTHVRTDSPDEIGIGHGGHTNYWRDNRVRPILRARLTT